MERGIFHKHKGGKWASQVGFGLGHFESNESQVIFEFESIWIPIILSLDHFKFESFGFRSF